MSIPYTCPQNVYKKSQKVYICCTATKCVIYYTLLTPIRRNPMFDFDKQIKEATAQAKKYSEMWIDWTITVLEQFKK